MTLLKIKLPLALTAFLMVSTANAGQVAQFLEINQTPDFSVSTTAGVTTFSASSMISFAFANTLSPNPYPGLHNAMLTLNATSSTQGSNVTGNFNQSGYTGSFSIIEIGTGFNLLSGVFGPGALLNGSAGSATFSDSAPPPGEVVFTSQFLDFSVSTSQAFSFSLSNGNPGLSVPPVGTFAFPTNSTFAGTGTFSADPLPQNSTPEPATLAMMGGALIGLGIAGRKKLVRR